VQTTIAVIGAGVYGATAALALRRRGYAVTLLDPGPLPHPLAASTDISKVVRMDYGPDSDYFALMERALNGWRRWNRDWPEPLFHEGGVMFLTRAPMQPGGFEYESHRLLVERGYAVERLDAAAIRRRFPAWSTGAYVDGYYNPVGGFAESGRVVSRLLEEAVHAGVDLRPGATAAGIRTHGGAVTGVDVAGGAAVPAQHVVVAGGAWTHYLLPALSGALRSSGMPVFHLQPDDPELFRAARFPTFGADLSATGYYGFPLHPLQGVVKIGNHGPGRVMHPEARQRAVTPEETEALRDFLRATFPALASAPIVYTRVCLYSDTWDGHFWIARDPDTAGLVVAAGDSGHAFKFAPVLGDLIADALEGQANPWSHKFRWRPEVHPPRSAEAARHQA
jgi:glycine/D-amino acid oxidase-like deaminating enzyme